MAHHLLVATGNAVSLPRREGGRDVAKRHFLLVVLASSLAGAPALGAVSGGAEQDLKDAFVGGALTCFQPNKIVVPLQIADQVRLKAQLFMLLRESILDDARGIVNIAREKEIRKLADKLKNSSLN